MLRGLLQCDDSNTILAEVDSAVNKKNTHNGPLTAETLGGVSSSKQTKWRSRRAFGNVRLHLHAAVTVMLQSLQKLQAGSVARKEKEEEVSERR